MFTHSKDTERIQTTNYMLESNSVILGVKIGQIWWVIEND